MAIQFRSPVLKPLLRANAPLPPNRGSVFRVTQQFNTPDFYAAQRNPPPVPLPTHGAVDIGDFGCGSPIVAMAPGIARRVQDNASAVRPPAGEPPYTNALGIVIDHGVVDGARITSEYWHLASWTAGNGARVAAGQEIGKLGNTGLLRICHCHIEAKRNGVKFDPEPLMFGGSLGQEDDVDLPNGLVPIARGTVGDGNRLRVDPNTTTGSKVIGAAPPDGIGEKKPYVVQVYGGKAGQAWELPKVGGTIKGDGYLWVGVFDRTWFVAEPLVTQIELTGAGRALLPAETAPVVGEPVGSRLAGFTDAKTKARVAVEAIKP